MIKAIEAKNLGKKYIISHEKEALVRHILPRFLTIKKYEEFWALKDINLGIDKGEFLGLIGRNGAGKSTLLNILAGITFPTQGKVLIDGKISAILSLGAGFHPELTGEENVYLNASILGLSSKKIKERFKEIVEFSELKDFIRAPLRTYSAGMYMRLGFSIAIHTDFDILLIDEIISVGDIGFQEKCLNKLKELHKEEKTLVLSSQSPDLLKELCDKIILLEKGKIEFIGESQQAIDRYQELMQKTVIEKQREPEGLILVPNLGYLADKEANQILSGWHTKSGTKEIQITKVRLLDGKGEQKNIFKTGENMTVQADFVVHQEIKNLHFGVAIFREEGIYCYGPNTKFDGMNIKRLKKGKGQFSIEYNSLPLLSGKYAISVGIWEGQERFTYDYHYAYYNFKIYNGNGENEGLLYLPHLWKLPGRILHKVDIESKDKINNFIESVINNDFQQDVISENLRIKKLNILNRWNKIKNVFKTGEKLILSVDFEAKKGIIEPIIWVGLFGEDKLYCQGTKVKIDRIKKGKGNFSIIYPKLFLLPRIHPLISLLPREYFLAFAIFQDSNASPENCCYGFRKFNIFFTKRDHGLVYIKHRWNLNLSS